MKSLVEYINESLNEKYKILFDGNLSEMSKYELPESLKDINLYNSFKTIIIKCYPSKSITDLYYEISFKFAKVYVTLVHNNIELSSKGNQLRNGVTTFNFGSLFSEDNIFYFKKMQEQISKSSKVCFHVERGNIKNIDDTLNVLKLFNITGKNIYTTDFYDHVSNINNVTFEGDNIFNKIPERVQILTILENDKKIKLAQSREKKFYCSDTNSTTVQKSSNSNKLNKRKKLVWHDIKGIENFMRKCIEQGKSKATIGIKDISDGNSRIISFNVYKDTKYKPDFNIYWMGDSTDGNETVDITSDIISNGIYIPAKHDDYYDDDVDRVEHYTIKYSSSDIKNALQQVVDKINSGTLG